ncbi:MAG: hypothetical protein OEZ37_09215, partial [Gemmatimonadota bacterium]|nr:hypothetical protein [Gemmatimonadota bacterium]
MSGPSPSIRSRVRQLLGAVATVMLLVVAVMAYGDSRNEWRQVDSQMATLALVVAEDVQDFLDDSEAILEALGSRARDFIASGESCGVWIRDVQALMPRFANAGVVLPSGEMVCSPLLGSGERVSYADRPWFRRTMETGRFTAGSPRKGRITG